MKDSALYARAFKDAAMLQSYGFTAMTSSEVRAMGAELYRILAELKMRGTQLALPLGAELQGSVNR